MNKQTNQKGRKQLKKISSSRSKWSSLPREYPRLVVGHLHHVIFVFREQTSHLSPVHGKFPVTHQPEPLTLNLSLRLGRSY